MAGSNKILKEGTVLFRAGDQSDGMYLVRRGELCVYLEQDGKEVVLTTCGAGGMIGEMALFDKQPRSASVKATRETEVTLISTEDFSRLMKQIPKWFVGLMQALSSRLRQTNDRLKKLETKGAGLGKPFKAVMRTLNILTLLWHKDGEKDGKDWTLRRQDTEKTLTELFDEDPDKIRTLIDVLVKEKLLTMRSDSYKNVVICLANRGVLTTLANTIGAAVKANPARPVLPDAALDLLRILERLTMASPYDTLTVSVADLEKEAKREGLATNGWAEAVQSLQGVGEEVKIVKTSSGPGLRTSKKDIASFLKNHEIIAALYKANLA